MNNNRKKELGASLIDALVGTTLFLGTAALFTSNTVAVLKGGAASERTSTAVALANTFVERVRGMEPWEAAALEDGEESGLDTFGQPAAHGPYVRRWTVLHDEPREGLARVDVSVSWHGNSAHRVKTLAYVCITQSCS